MLSRTARFSIAATTRRREVSPRVAGQGARIDPEAVRRPNEPSRGAAPRAGRERNGGTGAKAAGSMLFAFRCSRSSRSSGKRPTPSGFDGTAADQCQRASLRRRTVGELSRVAGSCRRQGDRRGGARGRLRHRRSGDAGVERLLGSLEADLKLLHLCGEDRSATRGVRQEVTAVTVYRSKTIEPAPDVREAAGLDRDAPLAACGTALRCSRERAAARSDRTAILAISNAAAQPPVGLGACRDARSARATTPFWPLRHGCATSGGRDERDKLPEANGLGRPAGDRHRLVLVGAAAATWALARYHDAARFLGVPPAAQPLQRIVVPPTQFSMQRRPVHLQTSDEQRIATLEQRLARVESATQQAPRIGRPSRRVSRRLCRTPCDRPRPFTRISESRFWQSVSDPSTSKPSRR